MSNRKDRIYNKDRIQRIKEASETAKLSDPNWLIDAPASIIPPDDDDRPLTRTKTPPFLKQAEYQPDNLDYISSKKLTLNELTQCNKDSSQLQDIMNSITCSKVPNKSEPKSLNYLELSRLKKAKERDDYNRQTAESLDKASEKWHYQMKEFNKGQNIQDSTGVKSSLFTEDNYDKSEHEGSEKRSGNRQFSGDFVNRLDMLLQRGMRTSKTFKSMGNLRNINERSYNRWSSRFDKFSSMWDLKYPLLHNSLGSNVHSNHFTPGISPMLFKQESKFPNTNTFNGSYNTSNNYLKQIPNNSMNINTLPNSNQNFHYPTNINHPYGNNMQSHMSMNHVPQYDNTQSPMMMQNYNPYAQNGIPSEAPVFDQMQYFNSPSISQQNSLTQFQPPAVWQNQFSISPFPPNYPNNGPMLSNNYPQNYLPVPVMDASFQYFNNQRPPVISNIKTTNLDLSTTFDAVTRKIDMLADKLDTLNSTVDQLKSAKSPPKIKSIIKSNKNINIKPRLEEPLEDEIRSNDAAYKASSNYVCDCPDCNIIKISNNQSNRKVTFELVEEEEEEDENEGEEIPKKEIVDEIEMNTSETISNPDISPQDHNYQNEKARILNCSKDVHPRLIQQRYRSNSRPSSQFQSFQLPQELETIMQHNYKRNSRD